jgi:hypothetical protein
MNNKVFLNSDGYIEIVLSGEQTGETFLEVYEKAKPLIDKVQADNKPLLGLCDLTGETNFSLSSNKIAMEYLEKIPYERIAMFGVPHVEVTKGIIMAMGKSHNTKVFDNRKDALAWLLGN